jgi:hypothetical protein
MLHAADAISSETMKRRKSRRMRSLASIDRASDQPTFKATELDSLH